MNWYIVYSVYGVVKQVIGLCYFVCFGMLSVLVDCGLFQGSDEEECVNVELFGFELVSVDVLLFMYVYLDYCGCIFKLVCEGFCGCILVILVICDLVWVVLFDVVGLQEEEVCCVQCSGWCCDEVVSILLYMFDDVFYVLDYFVSLVVYGEIVLLVLGVQVQFLDVGYILGLVLILFILDDGEQVCCIVFFGDQGNLGCLLLCDLVLVFVVDYVVMEIIYGNWLYCLLFDIVDELYQVICEMVVWYGNVIIFIFVFECVQEIFYYLYCGICDGYIFVYILVFFDLLMVIFVIEIFCCYLECFDDGFCQELQYGDLFVMLNLYFVCEMVELMVINWMEGGVVILVGFGMCNGGCVCYYLKYNLWCECCSVVFVGYVVCGILVCCIVDGVESVCIFNEEICVCVQIWIINGFFVYVDQVVLLYWLGYLLWCKVLLVYGDYDVGMQVMCEWLDQLGIFSQMLGMYELILLD